MLTLPIVFVLTPIPAVGQGAASPAPPTGTSSAGPTPAPPAVTLYDIVGELARTDTMQREIAATLRETSDLKALTAPLDAPILPGEFVALEERPDPSTRARYMELQALDVHIRERARAHNMATAELGRLTQKLVADVDRLDREARRPGMVAAGADRFTSHLHWEQEGRRLPYRIRDRLTS